MLNFTANLFITILPSVDFNHFINENINKTNNMNIVTDAIKLVIISMAFVISKYLFEMDIHISLSQKPNSPNMNKVIGVSV